MRDEYGNPLTTDKAEVILTTTTGGQVKARVIPSLRPGVNYEMPVPLDPGITSDLYGPTALRPTLPFQMKVEIRNSVYLPIEIAADTSRIGRAAERTLLNLTLGEDLDGDGLPDAWERALPARGEETAL